MGKLDEDPEESNFVDYLLTLPPKKRKAFLAAKEEADKDSKKSSQPSSLVNESWRKRRERIRRANAPKTGKENPPAAKPWWKFWR